MGPLSEEHKRKISEANKKVIHTEEWNMKVSDARAGKPLSEEHKKKLSENHVDMSGVNNPFYGRHHTEESKKKISDTKSLNSVKDGIKRVRD